MHAPRRDGCETTASDLEGLLQLLSRRQLKALTASKHPPLYAFGRLRDCVEAYIYEHSHEPQAHTSATSWTLFQTTERMLEACTGSERILRTPCPPGYVGVLRAVIVMWLALLPVSIASAAGISASSIMIVPLTSIISFLVLAVEEIAVEMENPFGFETNDLPLDALCLTIQADMLRLLDESKMLELEYAHIEAEPNAAAFHATCGRRMLK